MVRVFLFIFQIQSLAYAGLVYLDPVEATQNFSGFTGALQPGGSHCWNTAWKNQYKRLYQIPDSIANFSSPPVVEVNSEKGKIEFAKGQFTEVSIVDMEQLKRIVKRMSVESFIPSDYPENGCFARAHLMSMMLEKQGVITGKVFSEGKLRVDNPESPEGFVSWSYHVAPTVLVRENGKLETYVIDPSLSDSPLKKDVWAALQIQRKDSVLLALYDRPRFQYVLGEQRLKKGDTINSTGYDPADISKMYDVLKEFKPISDRRAKDRISP